MRRSIRCLLVGALTLIALRHVGSWVHCASLARVPDGSWHGALSFALAAVVDVDRTA